MNGSATNDGFGNQDTLSGIDNIFGSQNNDNIVGDDLDNTLNGFTGNDTLDGSAGNDLLYGADGDDTLIGSAGNDTLYDVAGSDTASYSVFGATQGINVSLLDGLATNDGFGNQDTLSGVDNIVGSQNNDTIVGDDLNNTLDGLAGSDTLTGLGGADTFVLSSPVVLFGGGDLTIETITDFSSAQGDKINIDRGLSPVSRNQFSYNPGNGTLSFQGSAYATLSSLPQDFNVQTDINLPPASSRPFPIDL